MAAVTSETRLRWNSVVIPERIPKQEFGTVPDGSGAVVDGTVGDSTTLTVTSARGRRRKPSEARLQDTTANVQLYIIYTLP